MSDRPDDDASSQDAAPAHLSPASAIETVERDPVRAAVAAVTCWLGDRPAHGRTLAAAAIDRDVVGHLDAVGALWRIVADVCAEQGVDVGGVIRDVALGVALADLEEPR